MDVKNSEKARSFGPTFEFFEYCRREYLLLLFLSLRYGADLGHSRLVFLVSASWNRLQDHYSDLVLNEIEPNI